MNPTLKSREEMDMENPNIKNNKTDYTIYILTLKVTIACNEQHNTGHVSGKRTR